MNIGKVVISFFLLVTYLFGFAHSLIPHQQWFESNFHAIAYQEKGNHLHHHHVLDEQIDSDHEHVLHGNHYDTGLYNLIICFFSETEHPVNSCEIQHYLPVESNNASTKALTKAKFVTILIAIVLNAEQSEPNSICSTDSKVKFLSHPLGDSPYRGPPSISNPLTEA